MKNTDSQFFSYFPSPPIQSLPKPSSRGGSNDLLSTSGHLVWAPALSSLLILFWHCCPPCTGSFAVLVVATLPTFFHYRCYPWSTCELAQAHFHNGRSCGAITSLAAGDGFLVVAILQVILPGILAGHCLCGPCLVGLHTVKPEEECPISALSLGPLLIGASSLEPTCNQGLGHTALGPWGTVQVATELFFLCPHGTSRCTCGSQILWV